MNALDDLLTIMRDQKLSMRDRINAAVSTVRIAPLGNPDQPDPPAVAFLRHIVEFKQPDGTQFGPGFRRECAAALAYYQRRVAKMLLTYEIPNQDERRDAWQRCLNGAIRNTLATQQRWPQNAQLLLGPHDPFDIPNADPERALTALLLPPIANHSARRQRAVDDPGSFAPITSEAEKLKIIKPIADLVQARILRGA